MKTKKPDKGKGKQGQTSPDPSPDLTKKPENPQTIPSRTIKKKPARPGKKRVSHKKSTTKKKEAQKLTLLPAPATKDPKPGKGGSTGPKGIPWPEVRNYYITAIRHVAMKTLAEHYKVAERTLKARASKEKWKAKRDAYWVEREKDYLDVVKTKINSLKMENLEMVRDTKRVLARRYVDLLKSWGVEPTAGDLVRLVKMELSLLGEADIKLDTGQDVEAAKAALLEELTNGKITRESLRSAVRRGVPGRPPD